MKKILCLLMLLLTPIANANNTSETSSTDTALIMSYNHIKSGLKEKNAILMICGLLHLTQKGISSITITIDETTLGQQQLLDYARLLASNNQGQLLLIASIEAQLK